MSARPSMPQLVIFADFAYFLAIFLLSLNIYIQTRKMHDFSTHRGIRYFRNSFLYFSMIYLFRFMVLYLQFLNGSTVPDSITAIQSIGLFLVIYFSFLAILSLVSSFSWKNYRFISDNRLSLFSLFLSSIAFFARLPSILLVVGIVAALFLLLKARDNYKMKRMIFTPLFIVYILLVFFILFDLLPTTQELVPFEFRLAGYIASICIFLYINIKVRKVLDTGKEEEK
jgi:hypothetical protein